jgi:DNA-binding transcriptional MerR regulator
MRIGDVSDRSGVSVRMLRHYDSIGLLSPTGRTSAGYRDYSPADLHRLLDIEALRTLGLSLAETRHALDDPAFDAPAVLDRLREETRERIRGEQELLARLETVGTSMPTDWPDILTVIRLLATLRTGTPRQRQAAALDTRTPPPLPALVEAYLSEVDTNAVGSLRWAVVRTGDRCLAGLLDHAGRDAATDRRIIEALADIGTPAATGGLRRFLPDPAAVLALGRRGAVDDRVHDLLFTMATAGVQDVTAAEILGGLPGTVDGVRDRLAVTCDPGPRHRLVQALGEVPPDDARELLATLCDDRDPAVAATARYLSRPPAAGR